MVGVYKVTWWIETKKWSVKVANVRFGSKNRWAPKLLAIEAQVYGIYLNH